MLMYLNDAKVAKRFGTRPDLGKIIPGVGVKKVTVGVRWSLPKMDYEPDDDVVVRPRVALICKGKGKWEVLVEPQFREAAERYLMDFCMGPEKPRVRRKRRRRHY